VGQRFSKRPSISTTAQQTFPLSILSIPYELIMTIMSFMDKRSKLAFAKARRTLYGHYEQYYRDKTAVIRYNPRSSYSNFLDDIELLQLSNGCLRLKFSLIRNSESSDYSVKILCLNQDFDVPKESDYLCANALIIIPSMPRCVELTASLKAFTNLKSLSLRNVNFDDDAFPIIYSSFIESIYLNYRKMTSSQLFENIYYSPKNSVSSLGLF
jgi:hypothetical protein